jgi:V-type H+-transporting ATPase 16kDa proteolipid subunit
MVVSPDTPYAFARASCHWAAGVTVGFCCIAAGWCIGRVGCAGIIALSKQEKLFTIFMMNLVFCEILGIFAFIISVILCLS